MSKFNWRNDFEIGNTIIDQQHKHLFEVANQIFEAHDKQSMFNCTLKLFHYIREHFKDEERLMLKIGYPHYESHVQAHEQILLKLEEIGIHFKDADFDTNELNELMADWLLTHILKEDMK